ncbi:hypothetical protein NMQ01_12425 [Janibacter sp. CX7]|uniref:hypothetical protein n=1 Tax=Janibacter sp. CX7 TaxID=2963431 RepID=UPI0020CD60CE|nr:hypothetical protein [Janibacter sp. CX7]UTT65504.1 hypothetical protein NMQ01_12425 [Janibacter sp. CX7]
MSRTPSKVGDLTRLVAVVVAAAVLLGFGLVLFSRLGGGGSVDGKVRYSTSDHAYGIHLGPHGWFSYTDDDGDWVQQATTGDRWRSEGFYGDGALTSDGTSVSTLGGDVRIEREGRQLEARGADLLVAHGDRSLRPGEEAQLVGMSTRHAAVVSCMSPGGEARLGEEVDGGRLVVSGVALEDASVTWSHDTEVGCDADLATLYPEGLPEQRYVLLTPDEETTLALDLDTGTVARTWRDAPRGRVIVREDVAVSREGDEVRALSLHSGDEVARTSCPGARLDTPGDWGGRLAAEATPLVRCGSSVRLLDGDRFVTVDAPPVEESQQVADGRSVVHDRFEISRAGDTLTFRDALADEVVGDVEVPDGFRISTNDLRGRLVVFYRPADKIFGDDTDTEFRIVDTRTPTLVATTGDGLSPGAEVSTDGFAVLTERVERRRSRSSRTYAWVVGVDEVRRRD